MIIKPNFSFLSLLRQSALISRYTPFCFHLHPYPYLHCPPPEVNFTVAFWKRCGDPEVTDIWPPSSTFNPSTRLHSSTHRIKWVFEVQPLALNILFIFSFLCLSFLLPFSIFFLHKQLQSLGVFSSFLLFFIFRLPLFFS